MATGGNGAIGAAASARPRTSVGCRVPMTDRSSRALMVVRRLLVGGAVVALIAGCGGAASSTGSNAGTEASVAAIQVQGTFLAADGSAASEKSGTGFVIDASGDIVTTDDLVAGGAFWRVQVGSDTTQRNARLLGASECADLAVLHVDGSFPPLALSTTAAKPGDQVTIAGFPSGQSFSITSGNVGSGATATETPFASLAQGLLINAQTTAGSAGSPVLNASGQVIGIVLGASGGAAAPAPGGSAAGAGASSAGGGPQTQAIAASEAGSIIDSLKTGAGDSIGMAGVADATNAGIAVMAVTPGSAAQRAGITAGDLLKTINGVAVGGDGTKGSYCSVLRSHAPTDVYPVTVVRNGISYAGEINGRELAAAGGGGTPPTPVASGGGSGATANVSIAEIQPFVPSAIWSTCVHSTDSLPSSVLEAAACSASGVNGAWYYLYDSPADLAAEIAADTTAHGLSSSGSCDKGAYAGTWTYTFPDRTTLSNPGQSLLCYTASDGAAWIEQADPASAILFWVQLKDGTIADLNQWWLNHATIVVVEPTPS